MEVEDPRVMIIVFAAVLSFGLGAIILADEYNAITYKQNCNALINSERVMMEGDPHFDWRSDPYLMKMWDNPQYQCDRFYEMIEVLGSFPKGERLE